FLARAKRNLRRISLNQGLIDPVPDALERARFSRSGESVDVVVRKVNTLLPATLWHQNLVAQFLPGHEVTLLKNLHEVLEGLINTGVDHFPSVATPGVVIRVTHQALG